MNIDWKSIENHHMHASEFTTKPTSCRTNGRAMQIQTHTNHPTANAPMHSCGLLWSLGSTEIFHKYIQEVDIYLRNFLS